MEKRIPVYECKITGLDNTGIYAISFVDCPANEQNFVALKKAPQIKLNLNRQKQVLTGVVLIPEQMIYRYDQHLGEYYIKFSAADIEKIAQKMMKTGVALATTTHQHESKLKGNYLTELWIVKDPKKDKAVALGLGEYPAGTLIASYKIEDPKYWRNEVLTGKVKGFSLEGIFNFNNVTMKKATTKAASLAAAKKPKLSAFGLALQKMGIPVLMEGETVAEAEDLVDVADVDEVDAGEPFLIFELQDGGEVWVDAEGFATLNGEEQAPAGEHALADGNFIVIDDSGMLVVTQEEAEGEEAEVPETTLRAAKARGKAYLKKSNTKEAQIAKLKAQIAELEKQPSARPAKPSYSTSKKPEEMTHTEKMAAVLKSRLDRKKGK